MVTITDRGRPVAQLTPIPPSTLHSLLAAGQGRAARRDIAALSAPDESRSRANSLRCAVPSGLSVAHCIDTSALAKLVAAEFETPASQAWLDVDSRPASCDLARTELLRTVRRAAPDHVVRARAVLDSVTLLDVSTAIFDHAGLLDPTTLRTLDAIHLAAALLLGDDLDAIVTYDDRLAQAALANGIAVISPA